MGFLLQPVRNVTLHKILKLEKTVLNILNPETTGLNNLSFCRLMEDKTTIAFYMLFSTS